MLENLWEHLDISSAHHCMNADVYLWMVIAKNIPIVVSLGCAIAEGRHRSRGAAGKKTCSCRCVASWSCTCIRGCCPIGRVKASRQHNQRTLPERQTDEFCVLQRIWPMLFGCLALQARCQMNLAWESGCQLELKSRLGEMAKALFGFPDNAGSLIRGPQQSSKGGFTLNRGQDNGRSWEDS